MIEIKPDKGNDTVYLHIAFVDENVRRGIRHGFFKLGKSLKKTASKQILAKDKRGRLYRIRQGKRIKNHRASAPGQSPANLSGTYRRNIGFQIKGAESMDFFGQADHSGFLEKGTIKMEPRPGLQNAIDAEERNALRYFESEINRFLK